MKTKLLVLSVVVLFVAACGGTAGALPDDELAASEHEIVNGNARSDVTFGGAFVDGANPCTGAFLAPDLVLTHARCAGATRVVVGGVSLTAELTRSVQYSPELVTLQLKKRATASVFVWRPSRTRVTSGERLTCFGFDRAKRFASGVFNVVDLNGNEISLRGGVSGTGAPFAVELSDDGGFCMRDGTFEIVATLGLAPSSTSPRAIQLEPLSATLGDLMNAIVQARTQFAITLVNDPNLAVPTVIGLSSAGMTLEPRIAKEPRQGFYLAPTGTPDVVVLVNAESGRCLQTSPLLSVGGASCNFSSVFQQWRLTYKPNAFPAGLTDGYELRSLGVPFCLNNRATSVTPCGLFGTVSGMWLNWF